MRTGAAAGHHGFYHETAFYGSDEQFLGLVVPFLADGLAAGEPVFVAFAGRNQELVRDALGTDRDVLYMDGDQHYAKPAPAIRRYRELFDEQVAAGARQIRVAGDVPHPGVGVPWEWWARYEAVVNRAYDPWPVWGLCPYDTRNTPPDVLDHVLRTHSHVATAGGHRVNDGYERPEDFLRRQPVVWRDPIEDEAPQVVLADPTLADTRAAVTMLAARTELPADDVDAMLLAASEAVTNAMIHGGGQVAVLMWAAPRRLVVTVGDAGRGPQDPCAGLVPTGADVGGLGLWLAYQVCSYVSQQRDGDRFTLRLVVGELSG
ncbi:sensor histidine kinase [Catellatospora tritici]|uniref:sensor histidine kinase n=1 Tax=Catellatospora tritici TaxID=2851566 RepID=UPI001C2D289D|nr:sensor histidine kinase [Catellatospora tritici]MBV1853855.1 sensor histidine kinase [Catellatospora tritici]